MLISIVSTVGRIPVKKVNKYKKKFCTFFFWFEWIVTNSAKHSIELCFHRVKVFTDLVKTSAFYKTNRASFIV